MLPVILLHLKLFKLLSAVDLCHEKPRNIALFFVFFFKIWYNLLYQLIPRFNDQVKIELSSNSWHTGVYARLYMYTVQYMHYKIQCTPVSLLCIVFLALILFFLIIALY